MNQPGTGNWELGTETLYRDDRDSSPPGLRPSARNDNVRGDFPILSKGVRGGQAPLVYLDSAATTHKPQVVIDATSRYYSEENANIHRGVYWLSEQATLAFDGVREQARAFLGAAHAHEIIFTSGTTGEIGRASCRERV